MSANLQRRFAPFLYILIFFAGFLAACLWFNPQDYLANLAPVVTAVAALALVWLLYLWAAANVRGKREWLRREKLIQQEAVHPVLHAAVQPVEDKPEMLVLAVHNYGKGAADKLRFELSTPSETAAVVAVVNALAQLPVFGEGLDKLAAGETYGGIFTDVRTLSAALPKQKFGGILKLKITCENVFGEPCISETALDLSVLNNALGQAAGEAKLRKKLLY
ncbi:hypothetical protein [Neisseria perflava]|uniref:hypothetical protein n=1 Tax=Neisseria perflava TaxID=33053 RepID=UPI00209CF3DE|nr:hypothetical protein [Neisseria perflava]MCP1660054.1 hypothetical protein [Neisseria perflava]MCP1773425.1 hypothetical protein [Neisseria perflava]